MKLYHGSSSRNITAFSFKNARAECDFGKGVYFTTNFEQAKAWACKHSSTGAVYECDIDLSGFRVLSYNKLDDDLAFVLYLCRQGLEELAADDIDEFRNADVIAGAMLDGNVPGFKEIAEKWSFNEISYSEFYDQINLYKNDYNQVCIKTKEALETINAAILKIHYIEKSGNIIREVGYENQTKTSV